MPHVDTGLPLAILSNMPPDVLAGLRTSRGDWLSEFAVTIFSCEVGFGSVSLKTTDEPVASSIFGYVPTAS